VKKKEIMNCKHENIQGTYISNPNGKDSSIEECTDCGDIRKVTI